jgi:hypothetical protein
MVSFTNQYHFFQEENYRWILRKKRQIQVTEIENEAHPKAAKKFFKDFIHFHSAKNEGNSITFSSFDVMPDFLKGTVSRPSIPQKVSRSSSSSFFLWMRILLVDRLVSLLDSLRNIVIQRPCFLMQI